MTTQEYVLRKAVSVVSGARRKTYGTPENNFHRIATLWSAWDQVKSSKVNPEVDVAIKMELMKIARLAESPDHLDSWIDTAGYAACGAQVAGIPNRKRKV